MNAEQIHDTLANEIELCRYWAWQYAKESNALLKEYRKQLTEMLKYLERADDLQNLLGAQQP